MTIFDTIAIVDTEWMDSAACRGADTEAFYDPTLDGAHLARRICRECPVRTQCLEYALTHDERYGIWGGCDPLERRMLTTSDGRIKRVNPRSINTERLTLKPQQRERVDIINDALACGRDAEQIAAAVGVSVVALERWIYRYCGQRPPWETTGTAKPGRLRLSLERAKDVIASHAESAAKGMSDAAIADSIGMKKVTYQRRLSSARQTLRAYGIRVPA